MEIILGFVLVGILGIAAAVWVSRDVKPDPPVTSALSTYEASKTRTRSVINTPVVKPKAPAAPRPSKPKPKSSGRSTSTYDSGASYTTYSSYDSGSSSSSCDSSSSSSSSDCGGSY